MKELKAVEILETLNKIAEAYIKQNPRATFTGFNFDFGISLVNLREALVELQELTQEKSCEGCAYFCPWTDDDDGMGECGDNNTSVNPEGVHKSFACIHYTPKG